MGERKYIGSKKQYMLGKMKNKKAVIIFVIVIVIGIITGVFCIIEDGQKNRTLKLYQNVKESSKHTFSMEEKDSEYNYKMVMAIKEEEASIDMYSQEEHTTTLVKNGITYFIMHDKEEYYVYENDEKEEDMLLEALTGIENKKYITGREEIEGKKYYYEEYEGISSFLMLASSDTEEEKIKTRFYYDGDNIIYIKTIIEGEIEELLKVECNFDVDEQAFEIPENYAEN